jgi:glycosyltransferase involved in cell wall biosynthesis
MAETSQDKRPGLAIIANCATPYRIHQHMLLSSGLPELRLHTLITHDDADFKWTLPHHESINVIHFGRKGDSPLDSTLHAPLYEWRKGARLIHHIQANDIRAVIIFGLRYISYLRTIHYCHGKSIPVFVNNDSNIRSERPLSPLTKWMKRPIYAWWLRRVSGVMPMGELGEQFFLKYGADPQRLYRVPYTPDYDGFATVDAGRLQRFHHLYGLTEGRRYLLFSGRLAPVKRVDLLIDAFAGMADERPEWDLLIVGDGALRDALRRRVPDRLRQRVVWTGFLEQEDLTLAYHAADVLVLPSDREPWAVVVQEALAAGLAVVASDVVGAAHELVKDGVTGRIFAAGRGDALKQALLDVTRPEEIDRLKQNSRQALREWRDQVDPVAEVRRALADAGVLPNGARPANPGPAN